MTATEYNYVCDQCGSESVFEDEPCDCDDTCTEHIGTIASLRRQVERLRSAALSPDDREALAWARACVQRIDNDYGGDSRASRASLAVLTRLIGKEPGRGA